MTNPQHDLLTGIITRYHMMTPSSLKLMVENVKVLEINKDDYVLREQKQNACEYFILQGILQVTIVNEEGEDITTGFYSDGMVLTPHFARTIKGKSIYNLQALTPVVLAEMPVAVLDSLRYSFGDIKQFGLKVVEQELLKSIHHDIGFRAMSAKQRLLSFRHNYPALENLIPHTLIASYLGITPVSFSRLRNELARKE